MAAAPAALPAQRHAAGRVVHVVGADTVAVAGVPVVLHRVGRTTQGPLDTVTADRRGRFAFRFEPDTAAAWLLSARYGGIEYFSQPLGTGPGAADTGIVVVVADTSSTAPVTLRQRTVLVSGADPDGTRTVLDWLVLANAGSLTRVSPDTLHPSWSIALPPEGQNVQLADSRMSQFSPDALGFRGDSVLVFAPISPGEKELMLQYHVPGSLKRLVLPAGGVTDSVFVLLEEGIGTVAMPGFEPGESQSIEGRSFRRWAGTAPGAAELTISLAAPWLSSRQLLPILVGLSGLGFAGLAAMLVRRRRGTAAPRPAAPVRAPLVIADEVARLDARYLGRQPGTPADEWERYLGDRARLKAELDRALARGGPRS